MWDNNSNAKFGLISSIIISCNIIFLRKLDLILAALVVPGSTL